jgi:hypothetical protein
LQYCKQISMNFEELAHHSKSCRDEEYYQVSKVHDTPAPN